MPRVILHADANSFFVSCELCYRPELRGKAVVVGGDPEARHGIVLAKSDLAKKAGIKTGQTLFSAKQLCPNLIILPPDSEKYKRFSKQAFDIYGGYTDRVEPFGIDEAWLDVSGNETLASGGLLADKIRRRMWEELGITASVGVANNKIFAKLGSDYRKPDATTIIAPDRYEQIVWPLPVEDLLYVGPSTRADLNKIGITRIGDLACMPRTLLRDYLGKRGDILWYFATGNDLSPVAQTGTVSPIGSIGNSSTAPRDLVSDDDIKLALYVLAGSVAQRLRESGFRARTVQIQVRDNELHTFVRQRKLPKSSQLANELVDAGMRLFRANYDFSRDKPVRSIGIRGMDLEPDTGIAQVSLFPEDNRRIKQEAVERTMDSLRGRFGHNTVMRAALLGDPIGEINPKDDHVIHPVSYF